MKAYQIFLILSVMQALVYGDTCGGNCPSNGCTDCICGTSPYKVDAASICNAYGWDQRCCQCIIENESEGNAHAQNRNGNGSNDVGVFQINQMNWGECNGGNPPCDVGQNLACAKQIYGWGGNNWSLWATCGKCGCCG